MLDQLYDNFDQQSEQLSGHDQSYTQLSPGAFRGRFLSAFLGPQIALHMEICNQAMEQEVGGSAGHFSLGVVLNDGPPFLLNGQTMGPGDVLVLPPGGALHMVSPAGGAILAVSIDTSALLTHPGLAAPVADWLAGLHCAAGLLSAPSLAARLREDAASALESAKGTELEAEVLGHALLSGIVSKLSLDWRPAIHAQTQFSPASFGRFNHFRSQINAAIPDLERPSQIDAPRRSVEHAFARHLSVGPLTYLRILRLHSVKRRLLDPTKAHLTIGDIAAENGFWDWSRFSNQYRKHFGELPSVTRKRLTS
ncbi:MAG: helix-turn-helix domain-containing protein [Rhodobacteraceae bacterium]|nr:helix-turn-helix domain-containing protein [Paracoccaceae bacterium]